MTQPALLAPVAPPRHPLIDLRCASCEDVDWPEADLAVEDSPWSYVQRIGETRASNHYQTLTTIEIVRLLARIRAKRTAVWLTWPLLAEWALRSWRTFRLPVSGGAWFKSGEGDEGHYGQGYHWAGCSELVLLYTRGAGFLDRSVPLRNAWVEPPSLHSEKPVAWQAQWIRRWVPPGGLVVDPFAGLGSVARATVLAGEGRRYLGTEIDPERHRSALGLLAQARA